MTPEQMKELLPVAVAYAEGKVVQVRTRCEAWADFVGQVAFLDLCYEWRVKPEPREWWLCENCGVKWEYKHSKNLHSSCGNPDPIHVREVLP